jgi:hypothetical protein
MVVNRHALSDNGIDSNYHLLHLGLNIKCEGFLFVNPVYVFAMVGTFLADGLLYYIFWESLILFTLSL